MTDNADLTLEAFTILREHFFDQNGSPKPFSLREKRNTQDNPLDEYICGVLRDHLQDSECVPAPGPLINPDLVLLRPDRCNGVSRAALRDDLTRVVGVEVKKLERKVRFSGETIRPRLQHDTSLWDDSRVRCE